MNVCIVCKKEFEPITNPQPFCSPECDEVDRKVFEKAAEIGKRLQATVATHSANPQAFCLECMECPCLLIETVPTKTCPNCGWYLSATESGIVYCDRCSWSQGGID